MKRVMRLSTAAAMTLAGLLGSCQNETTAPGRISSSTSSLEMALSSVQGSGSGKITISPVSGTSGFSARASVELMGVLPNSLFHLQQAPEVGRPLSDDGVGERAAELWPWQQPNSPGFAEAPPFLEGLRSDQGLPITIVTDGEGNGRTEFTYNGPTLSPNSRFDVVFRIVEDSSMIVLPDTLIGSTTDLRSDCFTLPPK